MKPGFAGSRPLLVIAALLPVLGCPSDTKGTGPGLAVSRVEVSPENSSVILGQSRALAAVAKMADGSTVPDRPVTWTSTNADVATVSASGVVTGVMLGGPVRIRATVDGVTGEALVTVDPLPVSRVTVTPGDSPLFVGSSVQLTANAFDLAGLPLSDRGFVWESSSPAIATVSQTGAVVGQSLGGPVTITAVTGGVSGSATVTVSPRPATRLLFAQQLGTATAGSTLAPAIRVILQDDLLNTAAAAHNPVAVELAQNPGGATLGGSLTAIPVDGIASFADLTLNRTASGYTLRVTSPGLQPATSQPFDVVPGTASRLTFVTAPAGTAHSGGVLAPQPVLQLRDAAGNASPTRGMGVTAVLTSEAGALAGSTTVFTDDAGVAAFQGLAIIGEAGSYALSFSATGIPTLVSGPIAVSAGVPTALAVITPPSAGAQNAAPLPQQPALQLRDAVGNPVELPGIAVTVALATGAGTLAGTGTVTTNASGIAAFSDLAITGAVGVYTLRFSGPGSIAGVQSGPITLGPGAPVRLGVVVQPSATAQVGVPFGRQPSVQLYDVSNNPVPLPGTPITAAATGATLQGTMTGVTDQSGRAAFTNLALIGLAGSASLAFSSPGLTSATSAAIALAAGNPARLTITAQPSTTAASGVAFTTQPILQVRDAAGNPVSRAGVGVTAAVSPGGATLGGGLSVTTDAAGQASFANLSLSGPGALYALTFSSPGLTGAVSTAIALPIVNLFTPNGLTISTSEGAPYGDSDFWIAQDYSQTAFGYGPTKVTRIYICLNAETPRDLCSLSLPPTGPLAPAMLNDIETRIASYSGTGIRLVVRFIYNFGPIGAPDVPIGLITTHVDQLAPILLRHKDLIFALEAGFIGTWGEWHSSTSGNDTPLARGQLLDRELSYFRNAFPILVRYPADLLTYTGSATPSAQLGLHDDFYASDPDDGGTWFPRDRYSAQVLLDYATAVGTTSMFAGEFAAPYPALQSCSALDGYSYSFHLQSLSLFIFPGSVADAIEGQGCLLSFLNKVGTRLEIQRVTMTGDPAPGGTLHLSVTLVNTGYGRVVRARPARLILTAGGVALQQTAIPLAQMDLRLAASAAAPIPQTFDIDVTLPPTLPTTPLTLSLQIPDPATSLAADPAYALPLNSLDSAGRPVFDPVTGYNWLATFSARAPSGSPATARSRP